MKRLLTLLLLIAVASPALAYQKIAVVERFTNASCAPCAALNTAWYTTTVDDLELQGYLNHIVYNVNWPGPNDPMYLFNPTDNMTRRGYYAVNSVPWIEIDGVTFVRSGNNPVDQSNFTNTIMSTYSTGYAPFAIDLEAAIYANDVIDIQVTITRDPADTTILPATITLQIGLLENMVNFAAPPGSNGEQDFPDVCRKMLDDAQGSVITVPPPGGSVSTSVLYIPDAAAQSTIQFDQVRILAFLQNDETKDVYQSKKVTPALTDLIHAAFLATATAGAAPFAATFEDFSTPATGMPIVSWQWDFDDDGTVDSTDPEPSWTYTGAGVYSVALTVSDGTNQHTTTRENYIHVLTNQADILVVNGIEYATYPAEFATFYNSSAIFGAHQVDLWDLFGDQGFNYQANPSIIQVIEMQRKIPSSVLQLYRTVIWVGNNYGGDLTYYDGAQVLDYVDQGGSFILATRQGTSFLTPAIRTYCGISSVSGDQTVTQLVALDPDLVNMPSVGDNSLANLVLLGPASEAVPIFQSLTAPSYVAGFRIKKAGDGAFIYVAGRPYRYDSTASYQNYGYMIDHWAGDVTAIGDGPDLAARPFGLAQNHPNPFNPSTQISFSLAHAGHVSLKIYDAAGRLVRTLLDDARTAADYAVTWDGRNDAGAGVAAGVYLYKLKTNEDTQTRRMVLVK